MGERDLPAATFGEKPCRQRLLERVLNSCRRALRHFHQETIRGGRINQMPAHRELLGEQKVHLLALYVYSLSNSE